MNHRSKPFGLLALHLAVLLTAGCFVFPGVSVRAQEAKAKPSSGAALRLVEWQDAFRKLTDKSVPPRLKIRNGIMALGFLPGKSASDFRLLVTLSPFASRETERRPSLWSCDVSGKDPVKLLDAPGEHILQAVASPTGKYVACVLAKDSTYELWLVEVKTKHARQVGGMERDAAFYWHTDNRLSLVRRSVPPAGMNSSPTMEWVHIASDAVNPFFQSVTVLPPPVVLAPAPKTDWVTNAVPSHKGDKIAAFDSPGQLEVRDATQAASWLPPSYDKPYREAISQWSRDDKYVLVQASPYQEFRDTSTRIFQPGTNKNIDVDAKLIPVLARIKGIAESQFDGLDKRAWVADSLWLAGSDVHKLLLFTYILPPFQACIPVPQKEEKKAEFFAFLLDLDTDTLTRVSYPTSSPNSYPNGQFEGGYFFGVSSDGQYILVRNSTGLDLYKLD